MSTLPWLNRPTSALITAADLGPCPWPNRELLVIDGAVLIRARAGHPPLTLAELANLDTGGRGAELIEGMIVITPAPDLAHEHTLAAVTQLLRSACPPEFVIQSAPTPAGAPSDDSARNDPDVSPRNDPRTSRTGLKLGAHTWVQPDIAVMPNIAVTPTSRAGTPALVVEVTTTATMRIDLGRKKLIYERAGIDNYWILDPHERTITTWSPDEHGRYTRYIHLDEHDTLPVNRPFPVVISPAHLMD